MYSIECKVKAESIQSAVLKGCKDAMKTLESATGPGHEFLGWLDLPAAMQNDRLPHEVTSMMQRFDDVVVIGIGGSYLGARAVLSAVENPFRTTKPVLHFAGHHLSARYQKQLLDYLENRSFGVIVISKSGTTTEPAIAFRFLFDRLLRQYGRNGIKERVVAITDRSKGALRQLSDEFGLLTGIVPDNVGGRFSVFSAVGLVPLAVAGVNTAELLQGAFDAMVGIREKYGDTNPALQYAAYRNSCYASGKKIELLVSYRPELHYVAEWWKQLFGESEGKSGKGIFPAALDFTTDLHSMGQWVQDGERTLFETVIDVEKDVSIIVASQEGDGDGLNYLAGKELNDINRTALQATIEAHREGKVPVAELVLPEVNEYHVGALLYTFEYACAVSAYCLGVNPFDQPGVEAYKKNMFRMLGKPG